MTHLPLRDADKADVVSTALVASGVPAVPRGPKAHGAGRPRRRGFP